MNERLTKVIHEMDLQLMTKGFTIEQIKNKRGGSIRYPVYLNATLMDADIAELDLSVRAYNCLKRAGLHKVGDLVEKIDGKEDLLKLRNLGNRSADEIMMQIMCFQYQLLKPEKQKAYVKRIVELNEV